MKIFIFLLISIFLSGCEKKISDAEFEQNVFDEVFIKVVDSTFTDQRLYTYFPEQGKLLYNEKGKWIGRDTTGQYQRDLVHERKRAILAVDTLNVIIAVSDGGLIRPNTNLEKYNTQKYIFKHLMDPEDRLLEYKNLKEKYEKFGGAMAFSNIKFDKKHETGTLSVFYSCGGKCGLGYTVFIKLINKRWMVIKAENTSIS